MVRPAEMRAQFFEPHGVVERPWDQDVGHDLPTRPGQWTWVGIDRSPTDHVATGQVKVTTAPSAVPLLEDARYGRDPRAEVSVAPGRQTCHSPQIVRKKLSGDQWKPTTPKGAGVAFVQVKRDSP